jgi:hypothetical protein
LNSRLGSLVRLAYVLKREPMPTRLPRADTGLAPVGVS